MNIGSSYYSSTLTRQFSQLQDAQAKAQAQIATGKTFINASEDPNAALATQRISLSRLGMDGDSNRRNLATRINEAATLSVEQARALLDDTSLLITQAFEDGADAAANAGLDGRIDDYIEQAAAFLNQEQDGRFLFGGNFQPTDTDQVPFRLNYDTEGNLINVEYVGGTDPLEFDVGLNVRLDPTSNPDNNGDWATWMNSLIAAKNQFSAGDLTATKAALDAATVASQDTFATTTDLIGKSLRIETLNEWSSKADTNLANQEASIQEADVNAVVLQFNDLQRNYEASLQSGRMLLTLSLVDFM